MADVRLIDANALKDKISNIKFHIKNPEMMAGVVEMKAAVLREIENLQTVEAEHVRLWRWIFGSSKTSCWMTCSICCKSQSGQTATFSYCPNCGAKMLNENN